MDQWTFWDWFWWVSAFVVLPVGTFAWNQWRAHRTYREIRRHTEMIGKPAGQEQEARDE